MLRDFSLKFIDIMIGVVLGIGFQWWGDLRETWQFIAFLFVYLNLVDYWIDYSPTVKRFPLKREIDVILHTYILFMMFYIVYATKLSISSFLVGYILYRVGDLFWIWRMFKEYKEKKRDKKFLFGWLGSDVFEIAVCAVLLLINLNFQIAPLALLLIFIVLRLASRILASVYYKEVYYE